MSGVFGREPELSRLLRAFTAAGSGRGGLVLVAGEAGIGKTALVAAAAERAAGTTVVTGACWDGEGVPDLWPWVQVVRALRARRSPAEWADFTAAAGEGLPILLGEQPHREPHETAFTVFDAVTTVLVAAARTGPLAVVLEDLQNADAASIRLLEFVVRHAWFERLLLIGTFRDVEPRAAALDPLVEMATTVTVTGLSEQAVAEMVAAMTGTAPSAREVAQLHRRTGGNPLFVDQTVRLAQSDESLVAPGIHSAVRRRLALLPPEVRDLLAIGSVLGSEFPRAALVALGPPVAARSVAMAMQARLLRGIDGDRIGFTHDLVREVVYESLGDDERRAVHARAFAQLRETPGASPGELARHAAPAVPDVPAEAAIDVLLAAARDADDRLALDEAVRHLERALDLTPATELRPRAVRTLDVAQALYRAGRTDEGRATFAAAAELGRALGDDGLVARAALTLHPLRDPTQHHAGEVALLAQVHRTVLPTAARTAEGDEVAAELGDAAAAHARSTGDDATLTRSLLTRHDAIWDPGTARERLAICAELDAVAARTGDDELRAHAGVLRTTALLETGDPRAVDEHAGVAALAFAGGRPRLRFDAVVMQAMIAALTGRFALSDALLDEAAALGEQPHVHSTILCGHARWSVALLRGEHDHAERLVDELTAAGHLSPHLLRAVTGLERGEPGAVDAALAHLDLVESHGGGAYIRWFSPLGLRFRAQAAAAAEDSGRRDAVRSALAAHVDGWAVTAAVAVDGPLRLWSAQLDAADGRWDAAVDGFRAARAAADRLGARPWSVRAGAELGVVLRKRGRAGDLAEAERLVADVGREASDIGMPSSVRVQPAADAVFRFDGSVWTLGFSSVTVHVPDFKGLRDLHVLLGLPGRDVPALQLFSPDTPIASGADPLLDREAVARYRHRLERLDGEIDDALAGGADGRAADLDRERSALVEELRHATGLGGRPRLLGAETERARKAVTGRIRDVIGRLDQRHPQLADHLRASISTGNGCRYQPSTAVRWEL
ncbi:ATP-binding protein [Pseudonocardia sp. TRM90224]|uniref:ATP-binding protein n=1 Tax=Pseudonocardia sp. TRM90224 TaxID=2812678 RepID=UPI001E2CF293|nr:AAA family ATPase [Pseudonocardia sp. TRM90224]